MIELYLLMIETEEYAEKVTYIYDNYHLLMCYVAGKYIKNSYDIEDIVHTVMLKIIDNIAIFDIKDEEHTKNLCCLITRQRSIDFCKAKKNHNLFLDEAIDYDDSANADSEPECIIIEQDTYKIILKIIESLSDTYKDVCKMKYIEGLKEREIAAILDISPKAVNQRIQRGKQLIRKALIREKLHD